MSFPIKFIILFFLIFFLFVLQTSWTLLPNQLSLLLILILVLLLTSSPIWSWLAVIISGIWLDLYSIFPAGLFLVSLICTLAIAQKIIYKFNITSNGGFFFLGIGGSLIYKISILLFSSLFCLLKFSEHQIVLNKFYWLDLIWFIILNATFIFFITLGIRIIKKRKY